MPQAKKKRKVREEREEEVGIEPNARDFVMARVAAARVFAQEAVDGCDAILALCTSPDDDKDGEERDNIFENAIEAAGEASRSLEVAQEVWQSDEVDPNEGEPDVDLSGDEDDEEDDDNDEDED